MPRHLPSRSLLMLACSIGGAAVAAALPAPLASARSSLLAGRPPDPSWQWQETCDGPRLGLDIVLDGKLLLRRTFTVCPHDRADPPGGDQTHIELSFVAPRTMAWEGYREDHEFTPKGLPLTVDIWQMTSDRDATRNDVQLGVAVHSDKTIQQHTGIVAWIDRRSELYVERGLVVRTYPLRRVRRSFAGAK